MASKPTKTPLALAEEIKALPWDYPAGHYEAATLADALIDTVDALEHAWGILGAEGYADDPDWSDTARIPAALTKSRGELP